MGKGKGMGKGMEKGNGKEEFRNLEAGRTLVEM
jgi:hypothetical protein